MTMTRTTPRRGYASVLASQLYNDFVRDQLNPTLWLQFKETAGIIADNSAYTLPIGPELFTNPGVVDGVGSIYTFTGDNPDGWDVSLESGNDPEISEVAAGEGHAESPNVGGGHINLFTSSNNVIMLQDVATIGDTYRALTDIDNVVDGSVVVCDTGGGNIAPVTGHGSAGLHSFDWIADSIGVGLKRNDVAGTDVTMSGSSVKLTGRQDGLITSATIAQIGKFGANHAYNFDGIDDLLTIIDAPGTLSAMTTQKWAFLAKADGLGESDVGTFMITGNQAAEGDRLILGLVDTGRIRATIDTSATQANAVSSNNEISDCLTNWAWYFIDFDDADILGNGRKIRIFKGLNGVVTQITLGTDTAATGVVSSPTTDFIVGNRANATRTFDGLMDEVIGVSGSVWSNSEMQTLVNFAGV